jgi:hypothetical protein
MMQSVAGLGSFEVVHWVFGRSLRIDASRRAAFCNKETSRGAVCGVVRLGR